jgi:hypothetical protein
LPRGRLGEPRRDAGEGGWLVNGQEPQARDVLSTADIVKLIVFTIAAGFYVSLIGLAVTWGRLAAARLPVDASLPLVDNKLFFIAGLRIVLAMMVVFALLCAVAYFVHTPKKWAKHAEAWREIVNRPKTQPGPSEAPDWIVRILAGFNVGGLAVALGLVCARFAKTIIDQAIPGRWWALILPWALFSGLIALGLARIGPLRNGPGRLPSGRRVPIIAGAIVVGVALVSSAPFGLLILTWGAIAVFGPALARHQTAPSTWLGFFLSPLPWVLLTIYALVGLAFSTIPPVSFQQAFVETTSGTRVGGYLARTGAGVYMVTCTPLATATSSNENLTLIRAGDVRSTTTRNTRFILDSGYRPSLPTLALHAFGLDDEIPTLIRPEPRPRKGTCAGRPVPRPSNATEVPRLGGGVYAGAAPPEGRAQDGEQPIAQQKVPKAIVLAARRFQPTLLATVADRFWPVSVGALLEDRGQDGGFTCLHVSGTVAKCSTKHPASGTVTHPAMTRLHGESSSRDFLEYPVTPTLNTNPTGQLEAFLRGQQAWQSPVPRQHEWLADPGLLNPWNTGQIYFYYAGEAKPASWPAPNEEIEPGLLTLQYWFFYPYNYYPTATSTDLMNEAPIAGDLWNTDLHQGDWEHVSVLVEKKTLRPRWLYTARHSDEGQYYRWNSPELSFDQGHPVVQAAYGGHPSYPPNCGARLRFAHGLRGVVSDWLACGSGRLAFRAGSTPLVDIAHTEWACWKGHFGVATATQVAHSKKDEDSVQRARDKYFEVAGPRSPLWQAENGRLQEDDDKHNPDRGFCAKNDPGQPEREAVVTGVLGRG